jgi:purine-nucleoside phosphorylase
MTPESHSEFSTEKLREFQPECGLVLGSGLARFADSLAIHHEISFSDVPGLPVSKVPGHAGRFLLTEIAGCKTIVAQGRAHLYEGFSANQVTANIRLMAVCGIRRVILTNAAGSLNPEFLPGTWMLMTDQLNLTGESPLRGAEGFIDLSEIFSEDLRMRFAKAAQKSGVPLHEGVYAGVRGPQYETPAEIKMLRTLGADAVGMSTVLETIQARALGLEVAGFSCLTNWAAGLGKKLLTHREVLETGAEASHDLAKLLAA